VRGDAVRGLTTAAIVCTTAAIGLASGAGLAILAIAVTAAHFVVVLLYPRLAVALPRSRYLELGVQVIYEDGRGILRQILAESTRLGFSISRVHTRQLERIAHNRPVVAVTLALQGQPTARQLTLELNELDGVLEVTAADLDADTE
jgi:putative Mg2+ transporter-C (MgtC) family protein